MHVIEPILTVERMTTTDISKPSAPTFQYKNVLQDEIKIFSMTLIPDTSFIFRGALTIESTGKTITDLRWSNMTDVNEVSLDLTSVGGILLPSNESFDVYLWNETDSEELAMTIMLLCGKVRP